MTSKHAITHVRCPNCHTRNRVGELTCHTCGELLVEVNYLQTNRLHAKLPDPTTLPPRLADRVQNHLQVAFDFENARTKDHYFLLPVTGDMIIGRQGESGGLRPDIDLRRFDDGTMGISRCHAMLFVQDRNLMIQDMDSTNGTYLQGERLAPNVAVPLRSNDRLRFGRLRAIVRFRF